MSVMLEHVTRTVDGMATIRDVSLTLERGTLSVLLGPTLSGKTSIMRLLAGLDKPTAGRVLVDGKDVTGLDVRKRSVAMVYQQFINYPSLSVYENIASPLRVQGRPRGEIDRRVREAAGLLKLEPFLDRTPLQLSGGQQQRTAIARALVKGADLVLLDEPLANLDYKLREELREELPKIFAASGAIFVYATTEPSEALLLGGNTATLSEGRITQFGRTIDVYRRPVDIVTARTFADPPLNTIGLVKAGTHFALEGKPVLPVPAHLRSLGDGPCTVAFQPHHLSFGQPNGSDEPLTVKTAISEITGSESFIHVAFAGARWVMLAPGIHEIEPDATLNVFVDTRHLMAFGPDGRAVGGTA